MAMLMGLSLLIYTIGQRQLRANLKQHQTGVKNQLGKLTEKPPLRWIFQQGIHLVVLNGVKQIVNLTDSRVQTLNTHTFYQLQTEVRNEKYKVAVAASAN